MKRIIQYLWSLRRQFAKYFIVGVSGVALDLLTLVFFKEILKWNAVLAVMVNQIFVLSFNFTLNKYWSFRDKQMPQKQIVKYLALAGFNYVFSVGTMYIFSHRSGFDYRLVRLFSIAVMVSWNFFLYKYWVYANGAHLVKKAVL